MALRSSVMKRLASVLLWSVIAAAFVGPGTVTTAALAGQRYGLALCWALVFSTFACLVLQEASARLALVSGHDLGEAIRERLAGAIGIAARVVVLGAVVLGCAAYEAGNVLGAVAGARLATDLPAPVLTIGAALVAMALLWPGRPALVARALSVAVAVMGIAFLAVAVALRPDPAALFAGALVPTWPSGAGLLVLGLVGTTVVPYNLFLGSGLGRGQDLGEMRFGLAVSVLLGGAISLAILVAGSALVGDFSYPVMAGVLGARFGEPGRWLFALGLGAAGLSSAITAPLAAAITARSILGRGPADPRWSATSWRLRVVWGGVLVCGVAVALSGVEVIPAIVLAQAFNGLVLPMVAVFLLVAVNDRSLMGERGLAGTPGNLAMALVVLVALGLGVVQLARASAVVLGFNLDPSGRLPIALAAGVAMLVALPVARWVVRARGSRAA